MIADSANKVTLSKWSRFNVSFLADFSLGTERFGYEEGAFSTVQIVAILKQAEMGIAVSDLIRQLGISEQPFYRWKK